MVIAMIVGIQGQAFEAAFASGAAERIFLAVAGVTALITIGLSQMGERGRREASKRWNKQMARWQQSWYCHRCHAAFIAGSSKAMAPEQFETILSA